MQWIHRPGNAGRAGPVVNVSTREALFKDLRRHLVEHNGFRLATLNLDHVVKLRHSADFAQAYAAHSHITADGNPIVWLSRLAGEEIELLPGSDLVLPVATLAVETGTPIALLGSSKDALAGASAALQAQLPDLRIALQIAPPMGFDPAGPLADEFIEQLDGSGAGLCFVALGAPKQELFAARAGASLPHMGFLSIGAGLDFLSGHQRRAPKLLRRFSVEWLWRLGQNPKRLAGRYAACLAILPGLALRAWSYRFTSRLDPTE